ncbi:MAG: hypothetical protein Kow0049_32500 [Stanieria sp.]
MSNENKFNQTYRDEKDHSIVVSFNNITLKISKLLEVANQIFKDKTLNEINQTLINTGFGSLANFGGF